MRRALVVAAAAALLAGCSEPAQDSARSYAGKEDAKAYSGDTFKGDKAKWESALAERAGFQNDYAPFRAAGKKP